MGLDTVELVMDIEDRFKVSIADAAAEQIQTIGDLYEFLMKRIRLQNTASCQSAALFYPIRKILVDEFNVKKSAVVPCTELQSLVTAENRHRFWQRVETLVSSRLPRLKRSKWIQWTGDVFPDDCETVAKLVNKCVNLNRITNEFSPEDSDSVWRIVCQIVSDICGVDVDRLKPETNFVNDLGFG